MEQSCCFQQQPLLLGHTWLASICLLPDKEISYSDLKALMEGSQSLLVVDVRSKEEVDKGHITGSIHIPGELYLG